MKDPAMLFYTSDFLTGVALLSMAERGQYITLLCLQQQHGHMTEKEMRGAVGKLSRAVLEKFEQDEDGKYFNRRAELEIQKRARYAESRRGNAAKKWAARPDPGGHQTEPSDTTAAAPYGEHMQVHMVEHMGNENRNRILNNLNNQEEIIPARARVEPGENDPELARFMACLLDNLGTLSSGAIDEALAWYKSMGGELCLHAVGLALDNGKRSWSYVRAILGRWEREEIKTVAAAMSQEKARAERERGGKANGNSGASAPGQKAAFGIRPRNAPADA